MPSGGYGSNSILCNVSEQKVEVQTCMIEHVM